jgi:hypothetical protein
MGAEAQGVSDKGAHDGAGSTILKGGVGHFQILPGSALVTRKTLIHSALQEYFAALISDISSFIITTLLSWDGID